MKFNFQLKFDSLFEFSAPAYDDRQISYLLTEAQFRVFIKRYNPLGNKYQKGFEYDEQRRRDLEQLITPALYHDGASAISGVSEITKSASQTGAHPKGIFLDLPDGFLYAIEEAVKLRTSLTAGTNVSTREAWVRPVKHDEYLANINNPYKQPYKDLVWRMDISRFTHQTGEVAGTKKRTELILPDTADATYYLEQYRMRYLATPPAIFVDEFEPANQVHCILDETLHREIVDEAVLIAQAAAQKESYQIGQAEVNRAE